MTADKSDAEAIEAAADFYTDETLAGASINEEHVHAAFKAGVAWRDENPNAVILEVVKALERSEYLIEGMLTDYCRAVGKDFNREDYLARFSHIERARKCFRGEE